MIWLLLAGAALLCVVALGAAVVPSYSPRMATSQRRKTYALSLACTVAGIALLLPTIDW